MSDRSTSDKGEPNPLRAYRHWLAWYPPEFRDAYGHGMCRTFRERWEEERESGAAKRTVFLVAEFWSVVATALVQRTSTAVRDIRYTLRTLRLNPVFTSVAVLTLALGIGANTAIFSVVNGVLLRPLPYGDPDRLIRIFEIEPRGGWWFTFSPPNFMSLRAEATLLEDVAAYREASVTLTGDGDPERLTAMQVSTGFFELLGTPLQLGRSFLAEEEVAGGDPVVILGHGLWQRRFGGDRDILGRAIILSDVPRTVVGVAPAYFRFGPDTPDPMGGTIVRNELTGEPTGILIDAAQDLVYAVLPDPTDEEIERRIIAALDHAARYGVTSVQDNADPEIYRVYSKLLDEGRLSARINAWYPLDYMDRLEAEGVNGPSGDLRLRRGTVKVFADGSMGAGSAWFYEPYTDDPSTSGLAMYDGDELADLIADADRRGFDIACHAIGDRAVATVLDAFERALEVNGDRGSPRRHRIEHAQVVREADMARFAALGIIASIQPSHAIDDMRWAEERIGRERSAGSYRVGSLMEAGAEVAFGTDWFVEPLDPRVTLYAAVTREYPEGGPEGGWFPKEKISLEEAITAYTVGSASAEGLEEVKGKLLPGYLADLAIFQRDLFQMEPVEWLDTPVILTLVGGSASFGAH